MLGSPARAARAFENVHAWLRSSRPFRLGFDHGCHCPCCVCKCENRGLHSRGGLGRRGFTSPPPRPRQLTASGEQGRGFASPPLGRRRVLPRLDLAPCSGSHARDVACCGVFSRPALIPAAKALGPCLGSVPARGVMFSTPLAGDAVRHPSLHARRHSRGSTPRHIVIVPLLMWRLSAVVGDCRRRSTSGGCFFGGGHLPGVRGQSRLGHALLPLSLLHTLQRSWGWRSRALR